MAEDMTTAILQARMGSTRLPGKSLLPLFGGKGSLELMLERLSKASAIDRFVVATTTLPEDDVLVELCERKQVPCFRGSPTDVLDRYYQCARFLVPNEDALVRLTGDCPLHDAGVVDRVVRFFFEGNYDYAANTHPPTYPDGLDVEVFTFAALEEAWSKATLLTEREHVTYYVYTHPEEFRLGNHALQQDYSHLRWTLDEPSDLEFIREVYARIGNADHFSMDHVLELLASQPELLAVNQGIERNAGLKKTLARDHELGGLE